MFHNKFKMLVKSVIFDADGSLVNWKSANAKVHEIVTGHKPSFNLRNQLLGKDPFDSWTVIREHYHLEESVESLLSRRNALIKSMYKEMPLYPGVSKFIDFLNEKNIPYAICSSVSLEETKEKLSGHMDIIDNAVKIVCREQEKPKIPDPYIFYKTLEETNFDPKTTLIIEDSVPGVKAATLAGCMTVFVKHFTYVNADQLLNEAQVQPTFTVPSLDEFDLSLIKLE